MQPNKSHALNLRRVVYVKFLRWVDAMTLTRFRKIAYRCSFLLGIVLLVGVPQFLLGTLVGSLSWHDYALTKIIALSAAFLYGRTWVRQARRWQRKSNQHTYYGLPVDELASYLLEQKQFTRYEAMHKFAISQQKHQVVAEELEKQQVLIRGQNNARVLNKITREELVRQLRDGFPLAFYQDEWVEKRGSYELFLRDKECSERKEQARIAKMERKKDRLKRQINELQASPFQVQESAL